MTASADGGERATAAGINREAEARCLQEGGRGGGCRSLKGFSLSQTKVGGRGEALTHDQDTPESHPRRAIATSLFPSAPKSIDLPLKSLFPFLGLFRICLWVAQPEKSGSGLVERQAPSGPPPIVYGDVKGLPAWRWLPPHATRATGLKEADVQ